MSRKVILVVLALAVLVVLALGGAARAQAPAAKPPPKSDDPCAGVPSIGVGLSSPKTACNAATGAAKTVDKATRAAGAVAKDVAEKGAVGAAASAAGDQVMAGVTAWVADAAGWFVRTIGDAIDKSTTPAVDSGWFRDYYGQMAQLGALLAIPMIVAVVLQALLRQDWTLLGRAAVMYIPLAFLLTGMAILVTQALLAATDEMSAWASQGTGSNAGEFLSDVAGTFKKYGGTGAATSGPAGAAIPLFAIFVLALVTVVGAFTVWLELVLREASIYAVVAFLPIFFVAMIWPRGGAIARRGVEILIALILSKFVLVVIFALAVAGLGRGEDAFGGALAGAALLVLAAFSPWVLFRLIPLVEHGAMSAAGGQRGALKSGAATALAPAQAMGHQIGRMWGPARAGAGGGASGGGGGGALAGGGGFAAAGGGACVAALGAGAAANGALQRGQGAVTDRAGAQTETVGGANGGSSPAEADGPARPPAGGVGGGPPAQSPGGGSAGPAPPVPPPPGGGGSGGGPARSVRPVHGGRPDAGQRSAPAGPGRSQRAPGVGAAPPPRQRPGGSGHSSGPPRPQRGL